MAARTRRVVVTSAVVGFVMLVFALQFVDVASIGCTTTGAQSNAVGVSYGTQTTTCAWWSHLLMPGLLLIALVGMLATITWSQRRRRRGEEAGSTHGQGGDIIAGG